MPKTYVMEVAPIAKNSHTLSYFSTVKLSRGTLVEVPLRSAKTLGVVLSSRSVKTEKSTLRQASYTLKKISRNDILDATLDPRLLDAVEETSKFYAVSTGVILSALMPKIVLEDALEMISNSQTRRRVKFKSPREPLMLQMETAERFGQYRLLVRQAFAKKGSVIFLVPTEMDVERAYEELSRGVVEFTYCFTLGKKEETQGVWKRALLEKHPILFITTPAGLMLPRPDIRTVIIDRENSRAYRTLARPYINFKKFVEFWHRAANIDLVMGDAVLSIESLWRERSSMHREENSLIRWRLTAAPALLTDASSKQSDDGRFVIFSKELESFIRRALEEEEKVFLFGARKGLYPTTLCGDCGFVLPCANCGAPVVLHKRSGQNVYVCHACGEVSDSKTLCPHCKSWKLVPLGIGTQEIARQAKLHFPEESIHILDKDHASTKAKAKNIAKKWNEEGGILVGTELAFFYLDALPYSAIVSLDALFSIPDFTINERIFYLVSHLRELTEKETLIQSRNIGKQVLAWAASGNIIDFYQNEIREREELLYPPFSIFIKIEVSSKQYEVREIQEQFQKWNPDILKNSIIIRLPREKWPDDELREKLSLLGAQFTVKVDPETIL